MRLRRSSPHRYARRAAAAVEMAVITPILVLITAISIINVVWRSRSAAQVRLRPNTPPQLSDTTRAACPSTGDSPL